MPRVLIDLRMVEGRLHGIARYAVELARLLPTLRPDWEFRGLVCGDTGYLRNAVRTLPLVECRAEFLSPIEQPALGLTLRREKPDLFHATSFSVPLLYRGRLLATLHDANHLAFPEMFSPATANYYRFVVRPRLKSAEEILTVSAFSRDELASYLELPKERFAVIPLAADRHFRPRPPEQLDAFLAHHGLPARYFAVVGNEKPHKSVDLIARLAPSLPLPVALLTGTGTAKAFGFPPTAVELPPLSDDELACFYAGATALLIPSRYEGFGLPALEAMASGCPVVAADAGSLPEVLGDAGVLVAPWDDKGWLEAARRLAFEAEAREELRARGLARARGYSWEACAKATLAAYERALAAPAT
jgi:glycosyltransferase involved in cell wall biosynthesis